MDKLTRRLFLSHAPLAAVAAGTVVSTVALAAPVAEVTKTSLPSEIMRAIKEWQAAVKVKDEALDAYSGPNAPKYSLPVDHPLRSAWIDADDAETQAQWKLLNLLKKAAA